MRDLAGRDDVGFDQYCKEAQNFAREHSDAGKERFERRATVTAKSMKTPSTLKIKTTEVTKGTEATRLTRPVTSRGDAVQKCYRCGKLDHISFDCPQKAAEAKLLKEADDMSFDEASRSGSDVNESEKE